MNVLTAFLWRAKYLIIAYKKLSFMYFQFYTTWNNLSTLTCQGKHILNQGYKTGMNLGAQVLPFFHWILLNFLFMPIESILLQWKFKSHCFYNMKWPKYWKLKNMNFYKLNTNFYKLNTNFFINVIWIFINFLWIFSPQGLNFSFYSIINKKCILLSIVNCCIFKLLKIVTNIKYRGDKTLKCHWILILDILWKCYINNFKKPIITELLYN